MPGRERNPHRTGNGRAGAPPLFRTSLSAPPVHQVLLNERAARLRGFLASSPPPSNRAHNTAPRALTIFRGVLNAFSVHGHPLADEMAAGVGTSNRCPTSHNLTRTNIPSRSWIPSSAPSRQRGSIGRTAVTSSVRNTPTASVLPSGRRGNGNHSQPQPSVERTAGATSASAVHRMEERLSIPLSQSAFDAKRGRDGCGARCLCWQYPHCSSG